MDVDPVAAIESSDLVGIIASVKATILNGNPVVLTPTRAAFPKSVMLSYANVKSWGTFEKNALCWIISQRESVFQLRPQRKNPNGGWEDDPERHESFGGAEAIDRIASVVAEQVREFGKF